MLLALGLEEQESLINRQIVLVKLGLSKGYILGSNLIGIHSCFSVNLI